MLWDRKLTWNAHINQLRAETTQALNIMRTLSVQAWGADRETLMLVYRMEIRPKIDYGCIVYGAVSEAALKPHNTVLNDAMKIATGAFKSTPIDSLCFSWGTGITL